MQAVDHTLPECELASKSQKTKQVSNASIGKQTRTKVGAITVNMRKQVRAEREINKKLKKWEKRKGGVL